VPGLSLLFFRFLPDFAASFLLSFPTAKRVFYRFFNFVALSVSFCVLRGRNRFDLSGDLRQSFLTRICFGKAPFIFSSVTALLAFSRLTFPFAKPVCPCRQRIKTTRRRGESGQVLRFGSPVSGVDGVMGIPFQFIMLSLTFDSRRLFSAVSGSPNVFLCIGQFTA